MKTYIRIVADTNDADYVESFEEISAKRLANIMPVIEAIKKFKKYKTKTADGEMGWEHHHNWAVGECLREDLGEKGPEGLYVETGLVTQKQFDDFSELVPFGEYGVHTVKRIEILEIESTETLYQHKYED